MHAARKISTLLFALYPLLIFVGLAFVQPRIVAALLLVFLLCRHRQHLRRFLREQRGSQRLALGLPLLLGAAVLATNDETLLLLYPAAVNASMLLLFSASLLQPPSTIEQIARLRDPDLSPAGVRYTRALTAVWCAFFVFNGTAAAYTAIGASRDAWALYNGLVAYLMMGALLAGERVARPWLLRAA